MKEEKIITLEEYLKEISPEYFEELISRAFDEFKNSKQTPKNIKKLSENITTIISLMIETLSDVELKELIDIVYNKETKNIDKYLDDIILKDPYREDSILFFPMELERVIKHRQNEEIKRGIHLFVIEFYVECNGMIEIKVLSKLLEKIGMLISKKELMSLLNETYFYIENDVVYYSEKLKDMELVKSKKISDYAVYTIKEIIGMLSVYEAINGQKVISEIVNSKVHNKKKALDIIEDIYLLSRTKEDFYNSLNKILENNKIKLTKEENDDLCAALEEIYYHLPNWGNNGYILCNAEDDEYDEEEYEFEFDIETYIYGYLTINGLINIKILKDLLSQSGFSTTEKELKKLISNMENLCIRNSFVEYKDIPKEILEILEEEKKDEDYKVLGDLFELEYDLDYFENRINELLSKYKIDDEDIEEIKTFIQIGIINEEGFTEHLSEITTLSPKTIHKLYNELKPIIKESRMWLLNGYKPSEKFNSVKSNKIGRNEPCPCGSGKKYKQCCGK